MSPATDVIPVILPDGSLDLDATHLVNGDVELVPIPHTSVGRATRRAPRS